jgi:hypothetical protein
MDFQGRYQILGMLRDGETRTFKAVQTSSGRTVLLHQLWAERTPPHQPDLASLIMGFLRRATVDEMKILVDMGEEAGRVFVVTEEVPICQDLRQWLQAAGKAGAAGKATVPKFAPIGVSGAAGAPGRLPEQARQESLASPDTTLPFTTPKILQPPVTPPPPAKAKDELDEFSKMFPGLAGPSRVPSVAETIPAEKPSAPPGATAAKPAQSQPPAGFEVVFERGQQQSRGPGVPAVEKPLPPPPSAPGAEKGMPGDFTRIFFGTTEESKAMPASPVPAAETTRLTPPGREQPSQPVGEGEFTRPFQAQQAAKSPGGETVPEPVPQSPASPPSAVGAKGPGEFTLLFSPSAPAAPSAAPPIPASSPQPAGPLSGFSRARGPGELTQFIQGYQPGKSAPTPPGLEPPEPMVPPSPLSVDQGKPGAFTLIFNQPSEVTTAPPPTAPSPAVVQTPPAAPPSPEPDEYMRMFELPSGGAGVSPQGAAQAPPPAVPPPAPGRPMPVVPAATVSPPVAPSMPYAQPLGLPSPMAPQPQPYPIPSPQWQQPAAPPAFAMATQPAMPSMQPMAGPVPAPRAAPPKTGKSRFLVPFIILGGLFIIAVGLILFFALKH